MARKPKYSTLQPERVGSHDTTVVVDQAPLMGLDLETGKPQVLGSLQAHGYDAMTQLMIQAPLVDGEEPKFSGLGVQRNPGDYLDPWSIQGPLVDEGYVPSMVSYGRNGGRSSTIFYHPELTLEDTISWDHARHLAIREDKALTEVDKTLKLGLFMKGKIGPSTRYTLTMGFLRWICKNGQVSKLFDMGSIVVSPATYNPALITEWSQEQINKFQGAGAIPVTVYEAKSAALDFPIEMMGKSLLDKIQGKLGAPPQLNMDELPPFVANPLKALTKQPIWFQESLLDQMKLLRQNTELFTSFDILNAVTNPGALASDVSQSRIMGKMDLIERKIQELILVGSFFAKVSLPEKKVIEMPLV